MFFNPSDWYWIKAEGKVFSSDRKVVVPTSDPKYKDWTAKGNIATPYPRDTDGNESDAELSSILLAYGIEMAPLHVDAMKIKLKDAVDFDAEVQRKKYITPGEGQALTYMQKSDEARRYLSAETPSADDYPLLSAEVGITANDLHGVALVVSAAYAQWQQIGAAIEAIRLGGKAAIDGANTSIEAQSAYDAISWPE